MKRHGPRSKAPASSGTSGTLQAPDEATGLPPEPAISLVRRVLGAIKLVVGVCTVVGVSFGLAWGAYKFALSTPRFAIQEIQVEGNQRFTNEQVAAMAQVERNTNIFAVDLERARANLLAEPWIQEAKLERQLPGGLRIAVQERQAQALAVLGDQLYLVSEQAEPFKIVSTDDPYDLPVVNGLSGENLALDRARELERLQLALTILRQYGRLPLSRSNPAQELQLHPEGGVALVVGTPPITLELGDGVSAGGTWRKKLLMATRVYGKLQARGQRPGLIFLDNAAHPERVVARMR